jgi:hypothetical protein
VKTIVCFFALMFLPGLTVFGQATWQEALARMKLPGEGNPVERENVISRILQGFQANAVVKAIIVLPAVSDDLYLINRDKPKLGLRATNLAETILLLTNATEIRVTFRAPFLLLHRGGDTLAPEYKVEDAVAVERLRNESHFSHALFLDLHWKKLRPVLNKALRPSIYPWSTSEESWHFARHYLAGWNLTDWELLSAVALSGNTTFTVAKRRVTFRCRTGT